LKFVTCQQKKSPTGTLPFRQGGKQNILRALADRINQDQTHKLTVPIVIYYSILCSITVCVHSNGYILLSFLIFACFGFCFSAAYHCVLHCSLQHSESSPSVALTWTRGTSSLHTAVLLCIFWGFKSYTYTHIFEISRICSGDHSLSVCTVGFYALQVLYLSPVAHSAARLCILAHIFKSIFSVYLHIYTRARITQALSFVF
jgi:hypothetical protein